jgi:integrase
VDLPPGQEGQRRQRTTSHDSRASAQSWIAQTIAGTDGQRAAAASETPVLADYLDGWLANKAGLRPSTQLSYRGHIDRYLKPHLGHLRLDELRVEHIHAMYRSSMCDTWAGGAAVKPATVRRIHATLRAALATAVRQGLLERNPVTFVELPTVEYPEVTVWTAAQAAAFLAFIRDDPLHCLYRLMLLCGLRRGEAVGLRWGDINLIQGSLRVSQQLVLVGASVHAGPPKSRAGRRRISLDADTVASLLSHKVKQTQERFAAGRAISDHILVFCDVDDVPVHPAYVTRHFAELVAQADLPSIRLHDLRHTSASLGLVAGESLKEISARLGHSSIDITANLYAHIDPQQADSSAARLAELLAPSPSTRWPLGSRAVHPIRKDT